MEVTVRVDDKRAGQSLQRVPEGSLRPAAHCVARAAAACRGSGQRGNPGVAQAS